MNQSSEEPITVVAPLRNNTYNALSREISNNSELVYTTNFCRYVRGVAQTDAGQGIIEHLLWK